MAYTPPAQDAVDFGASSYTPPAQDVVDFDVGQNISAPATTVSVSTPDAVVSPGSVSISTSATTVNVTTPNATVKDIKSITASVTTVDVSTPNAGISQAIGISAPATSVDVSTPSPSVTFPRTYADVGTDFQVGVSTAGGEDATTTVGVETWSIEGMEIGLVTDVSMSHKYTEITYRLNDSEIVLFREWMKNAENAKRAVESDGMWETADTSLTGNSFVISPPDAERPPQDHFVGYPIKKTEAVKDREGVWHEITVRYILGSPRSVSYSNNWTDETRGTDEWLFSFTEGDVATKRVQTDAQRRQDKGKGKIKLKTVLTAEEVAVLMESANRNDAVRNVTFVDGPNRSEDNSPDGGNTVTITPPANGDRYVSQGDYVIMDWKVERESAAAYTVKMDIKQAA